jgi:hypothetical protein
VQLGLEVESLHKHLDEEVRDVLETLIIGVGFLLLFQGSDRIRTGIPLL